MCVSCLVQCHQDVLPPCSCFQIVSGDRVCERWGLDVSYATAKEAPRRTREVKMMHDVCLCSSCAALSFVTSTWKTSLLVSEVPRVQEHSMLRYSTEAPRSALTGSVGEWRSSSQLTTHC